MSAPGRRSTRKHGPTMSGKIGVDILCSSPDSLGSVYLCPLRRRSLSPPRRVCAQLAELQARLVKTVHIAHLYYKSPSTDQLLSSPEETITFEWHGTKRKGSMNIAQARI